MKAPQEIQRLVENFKTQLDAYKHGKYNEAQLRLDYIDPFFNALGWDVSNISGQIETYRDVLVEERVRKTHAERVDYAFKLKRTKKFFVEAKKPSVDIKEGYDPALQIREYGWWGGLSVCVLSDFEEFAVYNTRHGPKKKDKADKHRLRYFRYNEYLENWDFFQAYFSKQAVAEGSLEKLADADKDKEKIVTVDNVFLDEIEEWRKTLAANIALQNRDSKNHSILNLFDLNLAVQTIIDRIIFLKFAESRGMESPDQLRDLVDSTGIYASLDKLFLQADKKYNSGLFKRDEDREFIPKLEVGDPPLKKILKFLEDSRYGFQVLPIEILGSIYERFLGKTIYFTREERAKIEEKPETRKAGGVYYTPEYIVSYIVDNTLGELLKNKKPQEAEKIRVLDPACGSGSFLVNAYDKLLSWHLEYYSQAKNAPKALKENKVYEVKKQKSKTYRLSITEKQRILLNNIYGVDIDRQAVEVSKLSLLLKLMEDEDVESEEELFKHSDVQMLPDLSDNIKCGNSLIGSDFYKKKHASLFPIEERLKINAFDWDSKEGFAEIMKAGGFDVVIGNPPYVRIHLLDNSHIEYFKENYEVFSGQIDLYSLFIERSVDLLMDKGIFSFIVPRFLKFNIDSEKVRLLLLNYSIDHLTEVGKAFKNVSTECIIFVISKNKGSLVNILDYYPQSHLVFVQKLDKKIFKKFPNNIFNTVITNREYEIALKIMSVSKQLREISKLKRGMELGKKTIRNNKNGIKTLIGEDLTRYNINYQNTFCNKSETEIERLKDFSNTKKILIRRVANGITATYDDKNYFFIKNLYSLISYDRYDLKFMLGVLNSKALNFYFIKYFTTKKEDIFPEIQLYQLNKLPIPKLDLSNPSQKAQHDQMVTLVDQMLATQKKLYDTTSPSEKAIYQKDADELDEQIDALVYELYELRPEEIKVVEGAE